MCRAAVRRVARASRHTSAPGREKLLDDAVFERMEGNHGEAAVRTQHALRREKPVFELQQLVIDVQPQRLKRPRRRMNFLSLRRRSKGVCYDFGELAGAGKRARGNDGARDPPGM